MVTGCSNIISPESSSCKNLSSTKPKPAVDQLVIKCGLKGCNPKVSVIRLSW